MYTPRLRQSKRLYENVASKSSLNATLYNKSQTIELSGKKKRVKMVDGMKFVSPMPAFSNPASMANDDDSGDDEGHNPFKFPSLFNNSHDDDVYTEKNHIYFKTDVTKESIDKLATEIDHLNTKMHNLEKKATYGKFTPKHIYLHITTNGGDLLSGFFGYDKIKASRVPINTVIEGGVASAGSLLSIAGTNRYMTPNSHLLIHQLRTGIIGTYEELVDEKNNCNQFMVKLVNLYSENCSGKMNKTKIRDILKRDIFWDTKTAIVNGLVDGEWSGNVISVSND